MNNDDTLAQTESAPGSFYGWRMVLLGFIAVNLALGLTFGSFGVLIKPVAAELDASRALASLAIGVIILLLGLAAPLIGVALGRYSIRNVMTLGGLMMAVGFALAAAAPSFPWFLAGYSLVAGTGCALLGIMPASTLITNWFFARRGLALGLISAPLLVAAAPPAVAWLVELFGWRRALGAQAAVLLLALPLLRGIVDRPEAIGQIALGAAPGDASASADAHSRAPSAVLLRDLRFWILVFCAGLITCGGIIIVSHIVPFATDRGIAATSASLLLTINGICGMLGALLFGWVADRVGPHATLTLIGLIQTALWSTLLAFPAFGVIALLLVGIGLCGGAVHPVFSALLGNTYGRDAFAAALGLASLLMLPFTFVAAPIAGAIFDATGSYSIAFGVQIGCFALATAVLLASQIRSR